jgi:hypothetical protein
VSGRARHGAQKSIGTPLDRHAPVDLLTSHCPSIFVVLQR